MQENSRGGTFTWPGGFRTGRKNFPHFRAIYCDSQHLVEPLTLAGSKAKQLSISRRYLLF